MRNQLKGKMGWILWLAEWQQVILDCRNKLHKGVQGTLKRVQRIYIWPQMKQEIEDINKNCIRHAMMQKWTSKRKLPTLLHWLNRGPRQILQKDHPGKRSQTKEGYQYLFVTMTIFPGWIEALRPKRNTAAWTVKMLLKRVVRRYGTAAEIGWDEERVWGGGGGGGVI